MIQNFIYLTKNDEKLNKSLKIVRFRTKTLIFQKNILNYCEFLYLSEK